MLRSTPSSLSSNRALKVRRKRLRASFKCFSLCHPPVWGIQVFFFPRRRLRSQFRASLAAGLSTALAVLRSPVAVFGNYDQGAVPTPGGRAVELDELDPLRLLLLVLCTAPDGDSSSGGGS